MAAGWQAHQLNKDYQAWQRGRLAALMRLLVTYDGGLLADADVLAYVRKLHALMLRITLEERDLDLRRTDGEEQSAPSGLALTAE